MAIQMNNYDSQGACAARASVANEATSADRKGSKISVEGTNLMINGRTGRVKQLGPPGQGPAARPFQPAGGVRATTANPRRIVRGPRPTPLHCDIGRSLPDSGICCISGSMRLPRDSPGRKFEVAYRLSRSTAGRPRPRKRQRASSVFLPEEFPGDVAEGAADAPEPRCWRSRDDKRETEVGDDDIPITIDQHICGLEVAMDDPLVVRVGLLRPAG